jgi:hypothetical protein
MNKSKVVIGDLQSKKPQGTRIKSKQSAWFLTINSNVRFEDNDQSIIEFAKYFRTVIEDLFNNKDKLLSVLYVRNKSYPLEYDSASSEFQLEKSPHTQMLHVHGIFLFIHHSNLLIRSKSLQNWILKELKSQLEGLDLPVPKNIYVHFDLIKNEDWESKEWNKQRMKDYIEKNKSFDHNKTKVLDKEPSSKRNKIEEFQNRMDEPCQ